MMLTGIALAGGAFLLGRQFYRTSVPKPDLATLLSTTVQEGAKKIATSFRSLRPSTIVLGGVAVGGSLLVLAAANGLTPVVLVNGFVTLLRTSPYAPLIFIAADAVRPLTLIPDTLSALASGLLFGPVYGTLISFIGLTTSGLVAYSVGRKLRQVSKPIEGETGVDSQEQQESDVDGLSARSKVRQMLARYGEQMEKHPFVSMVFMHALVLHYDLVNGVAGYLGLAWQPFLAGTLLGTLPSMSTLVLTGASLQQIAIGSISQFHLAPLAVSGVLMVGSIGLANYFNQRQQNLTEALVASNSLAAEVQ